MDSTNSKFKLKFFPEINLILEVKFILEKVIWFYLHYIKVLISLGVITYTYYYFYSLRLPPNPLWNAL